MVWHHLASDIIILFKVQELWVLLRLNLNASIHYLYCFLNSLQVFNMSMSISDMISLLLNTGFCSRLDGITMLFASSQFLQEAWRGLYTQQKSDKDWNQMILAGASITSNSGQGLLGYGIVRWRFVNLMNLPCELVILPANYTLQQFYHNFNFSDKANNFILLKYGYLLKFYIKFYV